MLPAFWHILETTGSASETRNAHLAVTALITCNFKVRLLGFIDAKSSFSCFIRLTGETLVVCKLVRLLGR